MSKILTLTPEQMNENGFFKKDEDNVPFASNKFFKLITHEVSGRDFSEVEQIDCTKIKIANDIQESWFQEGKDNGHEMTNMIGFLLMYGPAVKQELKEHQVEVENGAITFIEK